ncbi:MAG: amino acid adenylation domain-containing protein [Pseudomonadota bacterium]
MEGIAIIGMAGRFPGANDIEEFWRNLQGGKESVRFFTAQELEESGVDDALIHDPNYVRARAVLDDAIAFDAAFFGYQPREAEIIDPQQRVFLECCWHALENAGYDPDTYPGLIGVYAGAGTNSYLLHNLYPHPKFRSLTGLAPIIANDKDFLATRVSYKLNLQGPSMTVQTACSTSLVAVYSACQSLLDYQCDMALAGGVSISFPQKRGHLYQEGGIYSGDGHCRAFDAKAQGMVGGQGAAAVVLKRLDDAMADGDHIWAVIKGGAVNNDGALKAGYTAPSIDGQARVITMAQAVAGVEPDTVTYVEAHGTGTPLGDPIEIAGLTQAFRVATQEKNFCAIGSVKTNIGHLDIAAGVAGLVKTALMLHHKMLPPSLHFEQPNPKIDFANSPFYVNSELREWRTDKLPRRAGVSSFGIGGTNVHVVLEEAPAPAAAQATRPWQVLTLSAKTAAALNATTDALAEHLERQPEVNLADAAFTLHAGRKHYAHRRMLVCQDAADALRILRADDAARMATHVAVHDQAPVVFMFPGQGAQHVDMCRELYESEPVFQEHVNACAELLQPLLGLDLRSVLYPSAEQTEQARKLLGQTWITQPALFTVEYALAKLWMAWGVRPQAMIGHSLGEYTAACLAGVLTLHDALNLLAERARLVQSLPGGAMLAVRVNEETVQPLLGGELCLAAVNGSALCVVSGPNAAIEALEERLTKEEIVHRRLHTSHAFHSMMVEPILAPFLEQLRKVALHPPQIPYVSNVTGTWIDAAQATDPQYWVRHMRHTVRFAAGLQTLLNKTEHVLLEVGPGQTLSTLARQHPAKRAEQSVITSARAAQDNRSDIACLLDAVGRLWLTGATVNWTQFHAHERRRRVPLPGYAFERKHYWVEPPRAKNRVAQKIIKGEECEEGVMLEEQMIETSVKKSFSRREKLLPMLQEALSELSGLDITAIGATTTFLEMGFDSLFLTQISHALQKKFNVKVPFRQLLEESATLEALAGYLDRSLPTEALREDEVSDSASEKTAPAQPQADAVARQLALIEKQLEELRRSAALWGKAGNAEAAAPDVGAPASMARHTVREARAESKPFGPYKPIEKGIGGGLNARQQKHLGALIGRYTRRTAESKRYTKAHRAHFCDPRAVSGFRLQWKEMVYPIVAARSSGSKIWDVDGNEYIDLTMGFGVNLFGHAPPFVTEALQDQLESGMEIGPTSPLAGKVAEALCAFTGMERAIFCNTGSEAVMAALRAARTVSGRDKIALFAGSYHGIFDEVLVRASTRGGHSRPLPIAPGIPEHMVQDVLVLEYGAPASLALLKKHGPQLAAVLVEPVQSRHPDLQPREFLQEVRRLTAASDTALIFDEVITGFRAHPGGAQALFDVRADLATYGKVIGGGMPIGALAGRARYLDAFDGGAWNYGDNSFPEVGVTFFAGTFVRHPLALTAARAVLEHLKRSGPGLQEQLNRKTAALAAVLNDYFRAHQAPVRITHFSSMFYVHFEGEQKFAGLLFYHLRDKGIHIWEGRPCFLSTAHSDEDIDRIIRAFKESIAEMQAGGFFPEPAEQEADSPQPVRREIARSAEAREPVRLPLTGPQKELWIAAQLGEEASCCYNDSLMLHLRGPLNNAALREAVQNLVARHEALRTVFSAQGDYQEILPTMTAEVPILGFSNLNAEQRAEKMSALVEHDVRRAFDLTTGPLLRFHLVKLEDLHHFLLITAHHIVCDGWSVGVLLRDLGALYAAACTGTDAALAPPMQFSEYARLQAEQAQSPERVAAETYWVQQFSEPVAALELPTDRPRPPVLTYNGARYVFSIGQPLYQDIKRAAMRHSCTLFCMLLAAFEVFLHRMSGQEDIVVGIPAAGQIPVSGDSLVGHCVNFLPLRRPVMGEKKAADFLKEIKAAVLDIHEYQHYTYGSLLEKLNVTRDPGRTPLTTVTFNVDYAQDHLMFHDLHVEARSNPKKNINFDLKVNIVETGSEFRVQWDYNTDLFDAATIERWARHYQTLLADLSAHPGKRLSELALLTEEERQALLHDGNATATPYPRDATLAQLFEQQAAATPDHVALVHEHAQLTYAELNQRANALAHHLQAHGAGPEVRIGLCLERSLDLLVGLVAILKAGAAYVPLDPAYPAERQRFILQDAGITLLLTQAHLRARLPDSIVPTLCLDSDWPSLQQHYPDHNPVSQASADSLAYILYTSGSTGQPKGVMIEHGALVHLHQALADTVYHDLAPARPLRVSLNGPIYFDTSVKQWLQLLSGHTLCLVPEACRPDGAALLEYLATARIDVLDTTPTQLTLLTQAGLLAPDTYRPICLLIGGEALVSGLWEAIAACPDWAAYNLYGPTECTVDATFARLTPGSTPHLGHALPHVGLRIFDAERQPVPVGVAGELYIGGTGVGRGYLNRPDLTIQRFVIDPYQPGARLYQTGDRVRRRSDGMLEYLGRLDGQVKLRGYRIELGEIEALLQTHPGVQAAAVSVREDAPGDVRERTIIAQGKSPGAADARLVAYIVARDGDKPDEASLRAHLSARLPEYLLPSAYVSLPQLPLTRHGKLDRNALPAPPVEASVMPVPGAAPEGPIEQVIAMLYAQVLGRGQIDRHSGFFALGGHSLLAIQVLARLREALGVSVPVRTLFEAPSVSALCARLTATVSDPARLEARARLYTEVAQLSPEAVRAQLAQRRAIKRAGGE